MWQTPFPTQIVPDRARSVHVILNTVVSTTSKNTYRTATSQPCGRCGSATLPTCGGDIDTKLPLYCFLMQAHSTHKHTCDLFPLHSICTRLVCPGLSCCHPCANLLLPGFAHIHPLIAPVPGRQISLHYPQQGYLPPLLGHGTLQLQAETYHPHRYNLVGHHDLGVA